MKFIETSLWSKLIHLVLKIENQRSCRSENIFRTEGEIKRGHPMMAVGIDLHEFVDQISLTKTSFVQKRMVSRSHSKLELLVFVAAPTPSELKLPLRTLPSAKYQRNKEPFTRLPVEPLHPVGQSLNERRKTNPVNHPELSSPRAQCPAPRSALTWATFTASSSSPTMVCGGGEQGLWFSSSRRGRWVIVTPAPSCWSGLASPAANAASPQRGPPPSGSGAWPVRLFQEVGHGRFTRLPLPPVVTHALPD
jgi:hypothetical protein